MRMLLDPLAGGPLDEMLKTLKVLLEHLRSDLVEEVHVENASYGFPAFVIPAFPRRPTMRVEPETLRTHGVSSIRRRGGSRGAGVACSS